MKRRIVLMTALLLAAPAFAGKTYQVTGPVVDVSPASITVEKGNEKWEIARDAGTKGGADVKKGDKVTVEYKMTATGIELKGGKGKGEAKGEGQRQGQR
jgi:FKBP-type peptidyl-prolyl cis-trans isomerase (trigger factor)